MAGDNEVRVRLLGPVEVRADGGWTAPRGRKARTLLCVLADQAGLPVPVARIIDALWGDAPPQRARALVHTYVSTLRALLTPVRVVRVGDGYLLEVERSAVDCHVFAALTESGLAAIRAGRAEDGAEDLRAAEALWRGPALTGAGGGWAERRRTRLHEARLEAVESRVGATVDSAPPVAELRALVDEHPLRESLRALLVRALHREGRTGAALAAFADGRAVLVRELAVEPGSELRAARELVVSGAHDTAGAQHALDLGDRCYREDRYAEASVHYGQAVERYERVGDQVGSARARLALGVLQREWGLFDTALANLSSAVAVLRAADDGRLLAVAARSRGMVHAERGRFDEAMDGYREALRAARAAGATTQEALALRSIGVLHRAVGDLNRAVAVCEQAHELFGATGDRLMLAYSAQAIAKASIRLGRHDEAAALLGPSLDTCVELGDRFGVALVSRTTGELDLARGDVPDAVRRLDEAVRRWDGLDLPLWRARTQRDLARALRAAGDGRTAELVCAAALRVFRRYGSREAGEPGLSA